MKIILYKNALIILFIYVFLVPLFYMVPNGNFIVNTVLIIIRGLLIIFVSLYMRKKYKEDEHKDIDKNWSKNIFVGMLIYIFMFYQNIPQRIYGIISGFIGIYDKDQFHPFIIILWEQLFNNHIILAVLFSWFLITCSTKKYN